MSASMQNMEEAANIATEFMYSIDNLPNEVAHLLQEIKIKEARTQELQQEIDKDSSKYIRHSLRAASNPSTPSSPASRAPSPKSSLLPAKISANYAEMNKLADDKCLLAQQVIDLVSRTRARLDSDIGKVRYLQGDTMEYLPSGGRSVSALSTPVHASASFGGDAYPVNGRNAALQISESLRHALAGPSLTDVRQVSVTPAVGVAASNSIGASANKKRRVGTGASIKLTPVGTPTKNRSASPTVAATANAHTHQRSRLSRQIHPREDVDMDAEGDEDAEGEEGDADDETLYCFCQKQSYGDMIACDNEGGCPYEWFHLSCVGLKQPTPEKWYCSECKAKGAGATVVRKGRKK